MNWLLQPDRFQITGDLIDRRSDESRTLDFVICACSSQAMNIINPLCDLKESSEQSAVSLPTASWHLCFISRCEYETEDSLPWLAPCLQRYCWIDSCKFAGFCTLTACQFWRLLVCFNFIEPWGRAHVSLCQHTVLGRWAKRACDTWRLVWVKAPVRAHPSHAFRFSGGIICLGHVNCTSAPGLIYGALLAYRNQANKDGGKMRRQWMRSHHHLSSYVQHCDLWTHKSETLSSNELN